MSNIFHRNLGQEDNHIIHSFEYADASARTGATGLVPADVGRVARQLDNGTFYVLLDDDPVTWQIFITSDFDVKVAVDSGATADFIGATSSVGVLRTDSSIGYADGGDFVTLSVNEAVVDHDALLNFVANEHIDHTNVILTAGDGLAGGGDISASRTFDVDIANEASATVASLDEILIADVDDSDNIKKVTAQDIADLASTMGDSTNDMHFAFFAQSHDGMQIKETTTYIFGGSFIFRGTTALDDTPTNISISAFVEEVTNTGSVKIFDATNSLQIAEKTGINSATSAIFDMGTLANLPTGEAIFEIQGKLTSDVKGEDLLIQALNVYF